MLWKNILIRYYFPKVHFLYKINDTVPSKVISVLLVKALKFTMFEISFEINLTFGLTGVEFNQTEP